MDKKIIKFDETEILISNIDINKISNKYLISFLFINKILNILLVTKIIKRLDFYAYSFKKWVYKEDILIRLNVCILQ